MEPVSPMQYVKIKHLVPPTTECAKPPGTRLKLLDLKVPTHSKFITQVTKEYFNIMLNVAFSPVPNSMGP